MVRALRLEPTGPGLGTNKSHWWWHLKHSVIIASAHQKNNRARQRNVLPFYVINRSVLKIVNKCLWIDKRSIPVLFTKSRTTYWQKTVSYNIYVLLFYVVQGFQKDHSIWRSNIPQYSNHSHSSYLQKQRHFNTLWW